MACFLKAPSGNGKGCVTFTTQERDHVIGKSVETRALVESLKTRYLVGLHHNWHDHAFQYDPLFDFSMAGDDDLVEVDGRRFHHIPLDACNFAPPFFSIDSSIKPFWDVLYVARAVAFKGIPEFFDAIRSLYDGGLRPRVLFLCPTPGKIDLPGIPDLRRQFESLFSAVERERVTFLTIDWDYPFPLDLETLAFFYRHSRVFFHPAPVERRCRTAAYAWSCGLPVIAGENVASVLPARFHRPPFFFRVDEAGEMASKVAEALACDCREDPEWEAVSAYFAREPSANRVDVALERIATALARGPVSDVPINAEGLDIRLGRHNTLATGRNRLAMPLDEFCTVLRDRPDSLLQEVMRDDDPEESMARRFGHIATAPLPEPDDARYSAREFRRAVSPRFWRRTLRCP